MKTTSVKNYVTKFRNAFTNHSGLFILQPKSSMIEIEIPGAKSFSVIFGRLTGNGLLVYGDRQYHIHQEVKIECEGNIAVFERYQDSVGDVCLKEIEFEMNETKHIDFISELKKARSQNGIREVNNELFAGINSEIVGNVEEISTIPNFFYVKTKEGVKFTGSCKITNLKIIKGVEILNNAISLFVRPEPPKSITLNEPIKPTNKQAGNTLRAGTIIYDSLDSGFNPAYCARHCELDHGTLILDSDGSYTIPMKNLPPNRSYSVDLEIERINGNGKFVYGFLPDTTSLIIKIATNKTNYNGSVMVREDREYSVGIWRHDSSAGKIRVYRVVIKAGAEENTSVPITLPYACSSFVDNKTLIKSSDNATDSNIHDVFRNFATLTAQQYATVKNKQYETNANFSLNTFESRLWYAWNKQNLGNSTYSSLMPIHNSTLNNNIEPNIVTCNVLNIPNANKLYIEPFDDKMMISQQNIENIKKAAKIFTPSFTNSIMLSQFNSNIEVGYFPFMIGCFEKLTKKDQVFCIVDEGYLSALYESWKPENGILKVLDPKLSYSLSYRGFIEPVSIYDSYENIIKELLQSKYLIYVSGKNSHHINSFVELANIFNIPVATNNLKYSQTATILFRNDTKTSNISNFVFSVGTIPNDSSIEVVLDYDKCFNEFSGAMGRLLS